MRVPSVLCCHHDRQREGAQCTLVDEAQFERLLRDAGYSHEIPQIDRASGIRCRRFFISTISMIRRETIFAKCELNLHSGRGTCVASVGRQSSPTHPRFGLHGI